VRILNPKIDGFESSCFSGCYVTPEVTADYLESLEASTERAKKGKPDPPAYAEATTEVGNSAAAEPNDGNASTTSEVSTRSKLASESEESAAGNCESVSNAAKLAKVSNGSHIL
jgi:amidophosphoribosyltransferase